MTTLTLASLTVAIPTYNREQVLIDTIEFLMALQPAPAEILVLDQTQQHLPTTDGRLQALHAQGGIRWVRLAEPSIPKAMNAGLRMAQHDVVLFVDDDIRPEPDLIAAHLAAHTEQGDVLVAGRVIQPWQEGGRFKDDGPFHFARTQAAWVQEFMGGNFSVRRSAALGLGGFDENFVRVAYQFEAEFAHRVLASGRRIRFVPQACLHHLKDASGGTRTYGSHLGTWRPDHAVGAYYYALRTGRWGPLLTRPWRAVVTRHHLRRPWHIASTLLAEFRGMVWAMRLYRAGPRYAAEQEATV